MRKIIVDDIPLNVLRASLIGDWIMVFKRSHFNDLMDSIQLHDEENSHSG